MDIPAEKKGTEEKVESVVEDSKPPMGKPVKQESPEEAPKPAVKSIDINLGNVDVLTLRLLSEIRDEIKALRYSVTGPRVAAPKSAEEEQIVVNG